MPAVDSAFVEKVKTYLSGMLTREIEAQPLMAGLDVPMLAIRRQIATAINVIIHISRLTDGSRKITNITEVSGMEGEVVTMSDIFKFEQTGVAPDGKVIGSLRATGLRSMFTPRLEVVGYKLRPEIFGPVGPVGQRASK